MPATDDRYTGCTFDHPRPNWTVIHVTGEIDAASAGALDEEVQSHVDRNAQRLVIDLGDVTFIDSTGIRLVMKLIRRHRGQSEVKMVRPHSASAARAMEILGLGRIVPIVDTVDEALADGAQPA